MEKRLIQQISGGKKIRKTLNLPKTVLTEDTIKGK